MSTATIPGICRYSPSSILKASGARKPLSADLQAVLFRTQREQGERLQALAALETLEAELNRRRAHRPRLAP